MRIDQLPVASNVTNNNTLPVNVSGSSQQVSVANLTNSIRDNVYGAPLTASTSSAMTDQTRVYVYTGTTGGGFTNGHWYYYNGSTWTDGGVYNSSAVQTDTTLTLAGVPADAAATGAALAVNAGELTDLNSALFNGVNKFDFSKLSTTYYTYDGYTLAAIANDTRAEATIPIAQRYHLEAGKKYVFSADGAIGVKVFLYEPTTRTFAFNETLGADTPTEIVFTAAVTGDYVFKANFFGTGVHNVENPIIMWFDDWQKMRGIGITAKLYDGVADDVSINRAIKFANGHKFPMVFVPQKKTGNYSITAPIKMMSNVTLKVASGATLVLADDANCPMIQNANMTASSSATITDKNIVVDGGIWDGNGENQEKWVTVEGVSTLTVMFKFSGVENLTVKNCNISNSQTYGFLGCNIHNAVIDRCIVNVGSMENLNNCDGIHFLGESYNITVQNCSIHSEDNCIAFNADDTNHGYACFDGNIENVKLYNNTITNTDGAQGLLFLSATHHMYNVIIDGLYGDAGYCLKLDNFALFNGSGDYQDFDIRNVDFVINRNTDYAVLLRGIMGNIKFHNINLKYQSKALVGSASLFTVFDIRNSIESAGSQATTTAISNLEIDGLEVVHNWTDMEMNVFRTGYAPSVNKFTINHFYVLTPGGPVCPVFLSEGAVVNMLYGDDWNLENLPYGFIRTYGTGTLKRLFLNSLKTDFMSFAGLKLTHNLNEMSITGVQTQYFYIPYTPLHGVFDNNVIRSDYLFNTNSGYYFAKGQIVVASDNNVWLCTRSGSPLTTAWEANHAYSRGQMVRAESGDVLICIKNGTSGATLTVGYADFSDGSVTWRKLFNGYSQFVLLNNA